MPEIVNAVGGGDLCMEINLEQLNRDLEGEDVRYDPEYWPGIHFKFSPDAATILIFNSGKYNIAGAKSVEELISTKNRFLDELKKLGLTDVCDKFEIRNLVYLETYELEFDLASLSIAMGLERTEYEPENFPGLIYKPNDYTGTFLIFRTGKVLSTGSNSRSESTQAFNSLSATLQELFEC